MKLNDRMEKEGDEDDDSSQTLFKSVFFFSHTVL